MTANDESRSVEANTGGTMTTVKCGPENDPLFI